MKLTPDQLAFIHAGLCDAGYMASADALVEHIRDLEHQRMTAFLLWVDEVHDIKAERDRLKAALEKVAGMNPGSISEYGDCSACEDMITICASALK